MTLTRYEPLSMHNSTLNPEISCIVCHHKGDFIHKFVKSVRDSIGVTYEIIVITSDDELASNGIKGCYVFYCDGGPAEKRNVGSRVAKADYLAFFDDDVEVYYHVLRRLVRDLDSGKGMIYGKLHNAEYTDRFDEAGGYLTRTGFIWSRAGQNDKDIGQYNLPERILSGKSALCAIRRNLFNKVGGFDEDFWILGEETDLAWRVWLANEEVWFSPDITGIHYFNTKWKPANEYYTSKRVQFNGCRNYITMLIKNLEAKNLWKILPIHVLIWFTVSIAMLLSGKMMQGINILKGLGYVVVHLKQILKKRSIVQLARQCTDEDIFPHIYRVSPPKGYYWNRVTRYLRIGLHG